MHENRSFENGERRLVSLIREIGDELRRFLQTRIEMLQSEMRENFEAVKKAMPSVAAAIVLLGTSYLLFTAAIVALVVVAFPENPYRWAIALVITGVVWTVAGGIAAYLAMRQLRDHGLFPKRTVEVLKADASWLEQEARGTI